MSSSINAASSVIDAARRLSWAILFTGACSVLWSCGSESAPEPGPAQNGPQYVPYSSLTSDSCLDTCPYAFDGACDEPHLCGTGSDCTDCGGTVTRPAVRADQCLDTCIYANDGQCDVPYLCATGTDCHDCAGRGEACNDSCEFAYDGECDAPESCARGTDCWDCKGPVDPKVRSVIVVVGDPACRGAVLYRNGGRVDAVESIQSSSSQFRGCSDAMGVGYVVKLAPNESATLELRGACSYLYEQPALEGGTCEVVCLGCGR
jgi:hypothetical protein